MPTAKPTGLAQIGRRSMATDEEIIEAYRKLIELNGVRPNTNEIRMMTGCSYGKIERVLNEYKQYENIDQYHEAKAKDRVDVMTSWLVETQRAQAEHLVEIIDKEVHVAKEEWTEQAKQDQAKIKKLELALDTAKQESEELSCQLLEEQESHKPTQRSLEVAIEAQNEQEIQIAELRVELSTVNDRLKDKQDALDNSNRNFDHAMKESARQRKSLQDQLQQQTQTSQTALKEANEIIAAEREHTRVANEEVSTLSSQLEVLRKDFGSQTLLLADAVNIKKELEDNISELKTRTVMMGVQLEERQKAADLQSVQINRIMDERNEHFTALQKSQNDKSQLETDKALLESDKAQLENLVEELQQQLAPYLE